MTQSKFSLPRRLLLAALSMGALSWGASWAPPAQAQSNDLITLIVPFPAGGSADAFGRLLAEQLGKALSARVIVDNRPGASGLIGMDAVAKSAPDGRTLLLATNSALVNNIAMFDKMPLDIEKDLLPVAVVGQQSMLVVARKGAPYRNLNELLQHAKTHTVQVNRGSTGLGSITNLGWARFEIQQGLQTNHVPYKGDAPAMNDLLGDNLDMYVGGGTAIRQSIATGKLQGLAVMGPSRFADLPSVKTMRELGYPDADAIAWFVVAAPRATPKATVEQLAKSLFEVTGRPDTLQRMETLGVGAFSMDHAKSVRYVEAERARWLPLIRKLGIKAN